MNNKIVILISVFLIFGCAPSHRQTDSSTQLTVGTVQRTIHKGMSSTEVLENLGSPNIVTSDEIGKETWVYDKISSNVTYSDSHQYGTLLLIGGGRNSGSSRSSQKTLTIIIKLNKGKVYDFKYHTSRF